MTDQFEIEIQLIKDICALLPGGWEFFPGDQCFWLSSDGDKRRGIMLYPEALLEGETGKSWAVFHDFKIVSHSETDIVLHPGLWLIPRLIEMLGVERAIAEVSHLNLVGMGELLEALLRAVKAKLEEENH